eukprot:UN24875
MVDGFWQHGFGKKYMNATFSQTINLKGPLTGYYNVSNVFVVPHHTGISLQEVSHLNLMHPSATWKTLADRYAPPWTGYANQFYRGTSKQNCGDGSLF